MIDTKKKAMRAMLEHATMDEYPLDHFINSDSDKQAIDQDLDMKNMMQNVPPGPDKNDETEQEEQPKKRSQALILIQLAMGADLFHSPDGESYARLEVGNHKETWPIRNKGFKLWLRNKYYKTRNKAAGSQGLEDALAVLESQALFDSDEHKVYTRIAEFEGAIYIDMCDKEWQAIEVTANGWQIVPDPPVYFVRPRIMNSLPYPENGGSIDELKKFINFRTENDWKMIVSWLIAALRPDSPYPILTIQGEQGSAKSTTTKVLRSLVDPSSLPLRALPKEERDLSIASKNSWVLAFDNLSGLSALMSDALCKLSTGGGLATRKLYSDDEEAIFNIMRPVILNGIDDIAQRGDLLDRSIVLDLPSIPEDQRKDERGFWKDYEAAKPKIIGCLLDALSGALGKIENTRIKGKPRMADFALWITAAEDSLGWRKGEFMDIYNENRNQAVEQGIEADPFASAIMQLMETKDEFTGTPSQLLGEASQFIDERTKKSRAFPTAKTVRNRLKRINPALKTQSILYVPVESKKLRTLKLVKLSEDYSTKSENENSNKGGWEI